MRAASPPPPQAPSRTAATRRIAADGAFMPASGGGGGAARTRVPGLRPAPPRAYSNLPGPAARLPTGKGTMQKFLKQLRTLLVWLLILAVIAGVIFYLAQDLIAFPGRGLYTANAGEWHARVAALGSQGFLSVEIPGPGGATINGIWAKSGPSAGPAILWLHSREQTTTEINQDLKPLTQAGLHVFAMEFRGFGVSKGETSEANLLADGAAAIEWLLKQDNVAGGRVFVGGVGLGANLAMKIAA